MKPAVSFYRKTAPRSAVSRVALKAVPREEPAGRWTSRMGTRTGKWRRERASSCPSSSPSPPACGASAPSSHHRPASPSRASLQPCRASWCAPNGDSRLLRRRPACHQRLWPLTHLPRGLCRLRRHLRRQRLGVRHRRSRFVIKRAVSLPGRLGSFYDKMRRAVPFYDKTNPSGTGGAARKL